MATFLLNHNYKGDFLEGMKGLDAKAKKKLKQYDDAYSLNTKEARNYVATEKTIDVNRIPISDKVSKSEPKLVS